jgi:hypothetical protein
MKKFILLLILISQNLFSQNEPLLITEIDSICNINGKSAISEGIIEVKNKNQKNIGTGGFSIKTFLKYTDNEIFNKLSKEEKKKYNREKHSELIKGYHHQGIHYKDSYTENIHSQFYYQNNNLFYFKIRIIRTEKNKADEIQNFEYSIKELEESKSIKNVFLFDVPSWVREKNKEILQLNNLD